MRYAGLVANLSVLLLFAVAALLRGYNESLYYLSVQEDEILEWATFWGFVVAAGIYFFQGWHSLKANRQLPWFVFGLSLFCFFVAMEEISWGQRLLGYKAPDYFLEQNYQQEFNFHNVVDSGARRLVLQLILLGYGVALSGVSLWSPVTRVLSRFRVVAPPPMLIVSFLAMFIVYTWYPWSHTGEWVELAMGFGFAYAALFSQGSPHGVSKRCIVKMVMIVFVAIWSLAGLTVFVVRYAHAADPARADMARLEIEALARDFNGPKLHTRCGVHKRLYTFVREYQQPYLLEGEFARLLLTHGDDARADYLLDPWNSAYWIRHKCDDGREAKFVYSFGPNRRRDSSEWEIAGQDINRPSTGADITGDDIGVYLKTKK